MIEVDLPSAVVRVLAEEAEHVRSASESPGCPGFTRLHARVEEDRDADEPAVVLDRELSIDTLTGLVIDSVAKRVISTDDAEAWLRVLGMALACIAAEEGITDEDSLANVAPDASSRIDLVRAVQVALLEALDGPLSDPEGWE